MTDGHLSRSDYDMLIDDADKLLQAAVDHDRKAKDQVRRANDRLNNALMDYISTYPRKSAAQVHKERTAKEQALKQEIYDAGGDPRTAFLVLRGKPASPLDGAAIYGKGGSVDGSHGNAFRRGHLPQAHQNRQLTPGQHEQVKHRFPQFGSKPKLTK